MLLVQTFLTSQEDILHFHKALCVRPCINQAYVLRKKSIFPAFKKKYKSSPIHIARRTAKSITSTKHALEHSFRSRTKVVYKNNMKARRGLGLLIANGRIRETKPENWKNKQTNNIQNLVP